MCFSFAGRQNKLTDLKIEPFKMSADLEIKVKIKKYYKNHISFFISLPIQHPLGNVPADTGSVCYEAIVIGAAIKETSSTIADQRRMYSASLRTAITVKFCDI
jgi:hypothetical protein